MGWRLGLWDQDGTDFLADVVQAVANSQPDAVHTGGHGAKVPGETEAGIPRHRYMAVLVAHVVARQTQFGIAHRLAIEMDGDGRYAGDTGRPARDIKMAFDVKVHLIAGKVDLAPSILYALGHRQ